MASSGWRCGRLARTAGVGLCFPWSAFPRRKNASRGVLPDNTNVRFSRDVIAALLHPAIRMSVIDRF